MTLYFLQYNHQLFLVMKILSPAVEKNITVDMLLKYMPFVVILLGIAGPSVRVIFAAHHAAVVI